MKECECEPEHTIAKLGHCGSCPHYQQSQVTQIDRTLGGCSMRNRHTDGTAHDFDWATHEDETTGTGVCKCGLRGIDYDTARMP